MCDVKVTCWVPPLPKAWSRKTPTDLRTHRPVVSLLDVVVSSNLLEYSVVIGVRTRNSPSDLRPSQAAHLYYLSDSSSGGPTAR